MVGYFCSSSLKTGHGRKIHWTDGNQVGDAVHHQSNSQLQKAQHPRVSLVVRKDTKTINTGDSKSPLLLSKGR